MRFQRLIPLLVRTKFTIVGYTAIAGLIAALIHTLLTIWAAPANNHWRLIEGAVFDGLIIGSLFLAILTMLRRELRNIAELNHTIRGALYQIVLCTYGKLDKADLDILNESVKQVTQLISTITPTPTKQSNRTKVPPGPA